MNPNSVIEQVAKVGVGRVRTHDTTRSWNSWLANRRPLRRSRQADTSWKVCKDFLHFPATQYRGIRARAEHRNTGNRISHDLDPVWPLSPRRKNNAPRLDVYIKRIPRECRAGGGEAREARPAL